MTRKINQKRKYNTENKDRKKSARRGTEFGQTWFNMPESLKKLDERYFGYNNPDKKE